MGIESDRLGMIGKRLVKFSFGSPCISSIRPSLYEFWVALDSPCKILNRPVQIPFIPFDRPSGKISFGGF